MVDMEQILQDKDKIIKLYIEKRKMRCYRDIDRMEDRDFYALAAICKKEAKIAAEKINWEWGAQVLLNVISFVSMCCKEERIYSKEERMYKTAFDRSLHIVGKVALVYLYACNKSKGLSRKNNADNMHVLLSTVALLIQLENTIMAKRQIKYFHRIPLEGDFSFKDNWLYPPPSFQCYKRQYMNAMRGAGMRQRFASANSDLLGMPPYYLEAIKEVMNGKAPNTITLFANTYFADFPSVGEEGESKVFWEKLATLVAVNDMCRIKMKSKDDWRESLLLLNQNSNEELGDFLLEKECAEKTLNDNRLHEPITDSITSLITERPVIQLSRVDFASAYYLIGDKINSFVEKAFFTEDTAGWASEVRRRIATGFEEQVIAWMREKGFWAASVIDREEESGRYTGKWEYQDIELFFDDYSVGQENVGQVDVLAFNPSTKALCLIECKMLDDIRDAEKVKGNYKTLREIYRDQFKKKIVFFRKPETWKYIASRLCVQEADERICPIILTDIPLPVFVDVTNSQIEHTDLIICDFESFCENIEDLSVLRNREYEFSIPFTLSQTNN